MLIILLWGISSNTQARRLSGTRTRINTVVANSHRLTRAIAPTANGNTAPPVPPIAVENPMELSCKCFASSFVLMKIPAGNNVPKKKPKKANTTADPMNWETSQKMSSSASAAAGRDDGDPLTEVVRGEAEDNAAEGHASPEAGCIYSGGVLQSRCGSRT